MKITLERAELISLISKSLGYSIEDEDITISTDPFEVHIRNIDVTDLAGIPETVTEPFQETDSTDEADVTDKAEPILTMEDILKQNEDMGGAQRSMGPEETLEPPGETTEAELSATRRQSSG